MISKNRIKFIKALGIKKNRDAQQLFVAEGAKTVFELLQTFPCEYIAATPDIQSALTTYPQIPTDSITQDELERISFLKTPHQILAIFRKPNPVNVALQTFATDNLCLALDQIQDPGNMGTIIRLADWFGIEHIFCSHSSADAFSPKTVQATMGALARVQIHYTGIEGLLHSLSPEIPVYGTFLDGENIYHQQLSSNGIIVMGNEGNGISDSVATHITNRLYIPNFPENRQTSESLNVAIATSIVCAEFRRRYLP